MSALDEHLKKHRRKIIEREAAAFAELLREYEKIEKQLKREFDELQQKILAAQAEGQQISISWFFRERRLKNLLEQVKDQINQFGEEATRIIEREQRAAIQIAVRQARETFEFEIRSTDFPDRDFASSLNLRTVETAVGLMGDGSPIREYFEKRLAPSVAERIRSEVIRAAAIGTNFKTISKRLQEAGGITKHRAMSVARTEVNRVRREATRQIYENNSDILEGWEWVAVKSTRTCPLCLAMDGRRFPLDEPFPQHINCRCTMKPVILDIPAKTRTLGRDYFETLTDEQKEKILGKEAFLAYKHHNLTLDDFVIFRNDKRFGRAVSRRPLAKILADKGIEPQSKAMKTRVSKFGALGDWEKIDLKSNERIIKQVNDGSCVSAVGEMLAKRYKLNTNQQEILENIGEWSNSVALAKFLNTKETRNDVEWIGGGFGGVEKHIETISKENKVWAVMLRDGQAAGHAVLIRGLDKKGLVIIDDPFDQTTYKMRISELYRVLSEFVLRRKKRK